MPVCPQCGSNNLITAFDATFSAFCCDCDWVDGKIDDRLKKAFIKMFEEDDVVEADN